MATESKGGLSEQQAMVEGMRVAKNAARAWYNAASRVGCVEDALSGAFEGVVLAWKAWKPEAGMSWRTIAYRYAEEYAKREIQKHRSVVSTNYMRRMATFDGAVMVTGNDNDDESFDPSSAVACGSVPAIDEASMPDERADASMIVARVRQSLSEAAGTLGGAEKAMAGDIVARLLAGENGESLADIAARHGYTRQSAYRAETKLKAALAAHVTDC